MRKISNNPGDKYGKLTLINFEHRKGRREYWNCLCECGVLKIIAVQDLRSNHTKSCGCEKYKPQYENIINKKFGNVKVLEYNSTIKGHAFWKCLCDCGKIKIISGRSLRVKENISCGCLSKKQPHKDLTGQIFGFLKVLSLHKKYKSQYYYNTQCDCGNEKIILGKDLISRNTKSCGCFLKGVIKDLTNKTFGDLTVLRFAYSKKSAFWEVKCSCGTVTIKNSRSLVSGNTKSCGCKARGSYKIGNIYGILDDNDNVIYVGQTRKLNVIQRLKGHKKNPVSHAMKDWFLSINYEPRIKVIMKNIPIDKLDYAERKAVKFFNKKFELKNIKLKI